MFRWAKLEIGDYATPFEMPDYTTELLKCQDFKGRDEIPRPNLLINGGFQVRQRGDFFNFDTTKTVGYCFDHFRYAHLDTPANISYDNGMKITFPSELPELGKNEVRQCVEFFNPSQRIYTMTVELTGQSGDQVSLDMEYGFSKYYGGMLQELSGSRQKITQTFVCSHDLDQLHLIFRFQSEVVNRTVTLHNMKLEEGDYATPFEMPDYTTELLKCQNFKDVMKFQDRTC